MTKSIEITPAKQNHIKRPDTPVNESTKTRITTPKNSEIYKNHPNEMVTIEETIYEQISLENEQAADNEDIENRFPTLDNQTLDNRPHQQHNGSNNDPSSTDKDATTHRNESETNLLLPKTQPTTPILMQPNSNAKTNMGNH